MSGKPAALGGATTKKLAEHNPLLLGLLSFGLRFLEIAVIIATGLTGLWATYDRFQLADLPLYVQATWLSAVGFGLAAEMLGAYDKAALFSLRLGWQRLSLAWMVCVVGMLLLAFFLKVSATFSRAYVLFAAASIGFALMLVRGGAALAFRRLKRQGLFNQRLAVFGDRAANDGLTAHIAQHPEFMLDLVGRYDLSKRERDTDEYQFKRLCDAVARGAIDQVIITLPMSQERLEQFIRQLAKYPVLIRLAPDLRGLETAPQAVVTLGRLPLLTLFDRPISGADRLLKRIEDLTLSTVMLLVTAPLMAIVALAIKLESSGPVFFRQERDGYNHRPFRIWKFRSMYWEPTTEGVVQAKRNDFRVTRVGRFIRATSIDELPQLFNVLAGHMSLVGPRPHAPSTKVAGIPFREAADDYSARHRVRPGLTGWAQVNGWRGETDTHEKLLRRVELDLYYIDNWSIGFDLYILARTAGSFLFARNAY